ncbi:hypothetical protein EYZ11_006108 [Aspergillus tanneri]|uniref:Uncharacterized protein n=1 Tax=Aspergillus tanneri TaxID=1220188 RepID=A0A4S3JM86_9EURO|nr:hypothetical protein EYZ11_006108 [Aspergillus tanneri]
MTKHLTPRLSPLLRSAIGNLVGGRTSWTGTGLFPTDGTHRICSQPLTGSFRVCRDRTIRRRIGNCIIDEARAKCDCKGLADVGWQLTVLT